MGRPTQTTSMQPTTTPQLYPINLRRLADVELHFSKNEIRRLTEDELERVKCAMEDTLELDGMTEKSFNYSEGRARATKLIKAAEKLNDAIDDFRKLDARGTMTAYKLTYSARLSNRQNCLSLKHAIRALSRCEPEDLIGKASKRAPTTPRDRLSSKLLKIFDDSGGKVTKTKSKGGNTSSTAANWLVSVGKAISEDNPNYKHLFFTTSSSAEELATLYASAKKGS